jgi:mycofactocin precursor
MPEDPSLATESADVVAPSGEVETLIEDVLVEEVSIDGMCGVY